MHHPDALLFSSLRNIITKLCVQYLSKRDYGFREKVERTDGRTDEEKYNIDAYCLCGKGFHLSTVEFALGVSPTFLLYH